MASRQPTSTLSTSGRATARPALVAHRREVAHLGHGDEPLVGRVLAADAVEQVDLARRRQPADLEVGQPPHLQPAGDHRVQPAELDVLLEAGRVVGRRVLLGLGRHPERPHAVVVGPAERQHVGRRIGVGGDQRDPPHRPGRSTVRSTSASSADSSSASAGRSAGQREVDVDDRGVRATRRRPWPRPPWRARRRSAPSPARMAMTWTRRSLWTYSACDDAVGVDRDRSELADLVVAPGEHLEQRPGVGVAASRPSSARIGTSGSGQATSSSRRSGSTVGTGEPGGERPHRGRRPRPGPARCAAGRSGGSARSRLMLATPG